MLDGPAFRARIAARAGGRAAGLLGDAPSFAAVCRLPAWTATEGEARARLAVAAGVLASGPSLRRCLDGRVLQRLAERCGEAVLDAALDGAFEAPDPGAPLTAEALGEVGLAILRAAEQGRADAAALADRAAELSADDPGAGRQAAA